jgi:uncharacterized zinc-type alcohol dehydrogenase-like protein
MPTTVKAWAAASARSPLAPWEVTRRDPGDHDVLIEIAYCGVCHSDLHQVRDEWHGATFPMVPGHEIVGKVVRTGAAVTRFRPGDVAGVGCLVDSCRDCDPCRRDLEQFCARGSAPTYNGTLMDRKTPTYGGYSTHVVVDERFALRVPAGLDLAGAAPLLCAGITTWSPLRHWNTKPGDRVGVVGLGGLGHMAVKLAASLGAEVTVLSRSRAKEADARRLGAHAFASTSEKDAMRRLAGHFDLIVDTVSGAHDVDGLLRTLRIDGALVLVGASPEPLGVGAFSLIGGRKTLAGSLIGGLAETQELLDHCGKHGIVADVEVIPAKGINDAYERMLRGDVRYRFSIDAATM